MDNHCVYCGAEAPEGKMICNRCRFRADLVRITRCEDCRHWERDKDPESDAGHCRNYQSPCENQQTWIDFYCAEGEK